jgi:hypothetical protein
MITGEFVSFMAQGDLFRPSKVNAPFSSASDPGDIETKGRFKGKPLPFGAARFDAPKEEEAKIAYLHRVILPFLPALRAAGADSFRLYISYEYDTQCAIGFTREEVQMICDLQCDFPIDCWQREQPNQQPLPTLSNVTPAANAPGAASCCEEADQARHAGLTGGLGWTSPAVRP